jgi:hypothetical protein
VRAENARPGTLDWMLTAPLEPVAAGERDARYARQRAIEGYVSHTSIRAGATLTGFVSTDPPSPYRVDLFRMGHYGGTGGRLVAALGPFDGIAQAAPVEGDKQLVEARWRPSFTVAVAADWPSGVYLGKLTALRSGHQSYVIFVVRDDRRADLLFQVSDLTWQAYNRWPGWRSLYDWKDRKWHTAVGAEVSFDRPYGLYYNTLPATLVPLTNGSGEFLLWEMPLVFFLEKEGYDVTYVSNLDTHADPDGLLRARGFLSVGHDEYWTRQMLHNVARARDRGVSLAFLGGNSVDGEITLRPSSDGRPDRVFGRFEGRGPKDDDFPDEQALMGASSYGVGLGDFVVNAADHWLFAGTGLGAGDRIPQLVGWEYHGPPLREDPGLVVLASGPVADTQGKEVGAFAATIYPGPRGNFVFNAGTCWWAQLIAQPPGKVNPPGRDFSRDDPRVQRITRNLLDRMIRGPGGGALEARSRLSRGGAP